MSVLSLLFALLLPACADSSQRVDPAAGPSFEPVAESADLDFDAPLGSEGESVKDLSDAGLPFVAVAPSIGAKQTAYVFSPDDPLAAMVALVYEDPTWDRIIVYQFVDTQTQESMLTWEEGLIDQGCVAVADQGEGAVSCSYDPFTQVDIGNGFVAILGQSPEGSDPPLTTIQWIQPLARTESGADIGPENNLVIGVQGYARTFSPGEATQFAKKMVASQG